MRQQSIAILAKSLVQHDPNLADGLAGMKSFAAEVASSPTADITIYRTLVDEDFVLLHSRYDGVGRYSASAIAFDLFRFKDGKIVEHWGAQEPEAPPNLSGRTQVDGPTEVLDREKTEANRTLVRSYRETVMVSLRFDRIEEFIEGAHYAQHASKIGDGWSAPFGVDRYEAAQLAICRACSCSNLIGLLYPSAEWRRLAL